MQAVVLEETRKLSVRDIEIDESLGPRDVRVKIHTVGICGSDVHYYRDGRMGSCIVEQPLVLGHEASGTVVECGGDVTQPAVGDRVCMEPGIADPASRASRLGMYNVDPAVRFWATPPVHGCLRETVVHPADLVYKLPDHVGFDEGAMVEPLAIGVQAAVKARITPGDLTVVLGAGTIGAVTTLAALAAGCSRVVLTDVKQAKLDLIAALGPIRPVNVAGESVVEVVGDMSDGWGADLVFECSGNEQAASSVFEPLCPGGRVVFVGTSAEKPSFDVFTAQYKEASVATVFRYAHVYHRAVALIASGKIDVKPLITDTFDFADAARAFEWALDMPETSVKAQIEMP